jgi:hypothetical protein
MSMNRQQFDNCFYQQPDPEPDRQKAEKSDTRRFWFLCVPGGLLAGFIGCVIGDSGGYFIPVGGIVCFVLWAVTAREK